MNVEKNAFISQAPAHSSLLLMILTGKNHCQIKLQRLQEV